jgi:hypothetical protein
MLFYSALRRAKILSEMHIDREGPHGVGLTHRRVTATWPNLVRNWMNDMEWLDPEWRTSLDCSNSAGRLLA